MRERGLVPTQELESEKASGYKQGTARDDRLGGGLIARKQISLHQGYFSIRVS